MRGKVQILGLAALFALFMILPPVHVAGLDGCADGACAHTCDAGSRADDEPADGDHDPEECGLCRAASTPLVAAAPHPSPPPAGLARHGPCARPETVAARRPRLQPGARAPPAGR